ncbi:UbiX family flavin prenyltransferase [Polynucleobacter sp. AP-Titi-500A-B4]|jgi:4-hydroxy-3-polyprenylbenzoate decarboxylase|uniref:UbiX family flavin prenyltransferase n=1 Tax=Polynucleobacter sp. AP-Titi-500A-B4 TaxID=2576923 RepID=UPI001BFE2190|nr:UbiX family flavin prenyltransferase [Polynucleobacter sp. AP-Titi-500A-B4]QWE13277.1 UbiX family flavin prenyltransferase [Polynucleobacter sp. AP-Titi-500A-B4]
MNKRLIVAITGASGTIYGIRILEALREIGVESHLVMSDSAKLTMSAETNYKPAQVEALADVVHSAKNVGASISSGSFKSLGMVIAPCSIRTLSEIATGVTSSLVSRAADVVLKERRRLVLMVRETPLHAGHLRSMSQVTECGAIIMPPVPAFYAMPKSLDEMVNHTVGRCLDLFELDNQLVTRWSGMEANK